MNVYRKLLCFSICYFDPGIILGLFSDRKSIVRDRNIDFLKNVANMFLIEKSICCWTIDFTIKQTQNKTGEKRGDAWKNLGKTTKNNKSNFEKVLKSDSDPGNVRKVNFLYTFWWFLLKTINNYRENQFFLHGDMNKTGSVFTFLGFLVQTIKNHKEKQLFSNFVNLVRICEI